MHPAWAHPDCQRPASARPAFHTLILLQALSEMGPIKMQVACLLPVACALPPRLAVQARCMAQPAANATAVQCLCFLRAAERLW